MKFICCLPGLEVAFTLFALLTPSSRTFSPSLLFASQLQWMQTQDSNQLSIQPPKNCISKEFLAKRKETGFQAAVAFLLGSLVFVVDGCFYISEAGLTLHTLLYTVGSLLFAIGSGLLLL